MNVGRMAIKGAKVFKRFFIRNSENICTVAAASALVIFGIETVKAVPKVKEIIDEKKEDLQSCDPEDKETQKEVIWEGVKEVTPIVIKPVVAGVACLTFIVGQNVISKRKQAALAVAYSLSEQTIDAYEEKLEEIVGKKKAEQVKEAVVHEMVEPFQGGGIVDTGTGTQLFFMAGTGVFFRSSMDHVRLIFERINSRLADYESVDFNDLLDDLGLERCKYGDLVGWSVRDGERAEVDLRETGMYCDRSGHEEPYVFISSNETPLTNLYGDIDFKNYRRY